MRARLLTTIAWTLAGCSTGGFVGGDGGGQADLAVSARNDLGGGHDLGAATQVQGTISGESFGAANALSVTEPDSAGGTTTLVDITDASGVCTLAMTNGGIPDGHVIAMSLYGPTVGPVTGPATLAVSSSFTPQANSALVHWSKAVNQCTAEQDTGMSGTVTVTRVDAQGVQGTFVIHFQGGDLSGSFLAPPCSALASWNPPHGPGC